jgi:hypothetical protein
VDLTQNDQQTTPQPRSTTAKTPQSFTNTAPQNHRPHLPSSPDTPQVVPTPATQVTTHHNLQHHSQGRFQEIAGDPGITYTIAITRLRLAQRRAPMMNALDPAQDRLQNCHACLRAPLVIRWLKKALGLTNSDLCGFELTATPDLADSGSDDQACGCCCDVS